MWPLSAIWTFIVGDKYELTIEGQQVHQPSISTPAVLPIRGPRPTIDPLGLDATVYRSPRPSSALRERYLHRQIPPRSNRSRSPSPEPAFASLPTPATGSSQPTRTYRTPAGNQYSLMNMQGRFPLPPPFGPHRPLIFAHRTDGQPSPPYSPTISLWRRNSGLVSVTSSSRRAVKLRRTQIPAKVGKPSKEGKSPEPRRSCRKPSPKLLPPGVVLDPWNKSKKKMTKKSLGKDKNYVDRASSESPAPSPTLSKAHKPIADKTYRDKPLPDSPTPSPTTPKSKKRRAEEAFKADAPSMKRKPGRPPTKTKPAAISFDTSAS